MMERSHAATIELLPDDGPAGDETQPLTRAWFDGVREACVRTGRVPGVERLLFEWWIDEPPIEGLTQLPWLFGVWHGHWVCWAGTAPWAAANIAARSTYDAHRVMAGVQFGAEPDHPPATPWPPFGTAALAVPTTILVALSGKPAPAHALIPATPLFTPSPTPEPPPPPPAVESVVEPTPAPDGTPEPIADAATRTEPGVEVEPRDAIGPTDETDAQGLADSASGQPDSGPQAATEVEPSEPARVPAPLAPIEAPQPQNLPPAGWHPDPSGRHAMRYWDGATWTAHAADPGTDTIHDPI